MKEMLSLGLRVRKGQLEVLDQTKLPDQETWLNGSDPSEMSTLIKNLSVRGAPLIGVAAALTVGVYAETRKSLDQILEACALLRDSRPTAVNLMNAIDRMKGISIQSKGDVQAIVREAEKIFDEDVQLCMNMAKRASEFIADGDQLITHCNSGGLATAGIGTALGAVIYAHQQGKHVHIYADETRPLLQGARLTTWELRKFGVPHTLICDNMAASLMSTKKIHGVFVGSDRIAKNGDAANKVGTYGLAVHAKHHGIPFYVVAPRTTFDPACPSGSKIPIEQRQSGEVTGPGVTRESGVWNPAFDVTPRALITKIIFDDEVWS